MTTRHDERYKRAIARITDVRRMELWDRAATELGYSPEAYKLSEESEIRCLQEMKLGIRQGRS